VAGVEGLVVGPGLVVEAPRGLPQVFQDEDEVADDADLDLAHQGLSLDQSNLRLGAVDEYDQSRWWSESWSSAPIRCPTTVRQFSQVDPHRFGSERLPGAGSTLDHAER
jgi:hypothetical protein